MTQPDLYYFETMQMTSQAQPKFTEKFTAVELRDTIQEKGYYTD